MIADISTLPALDTAIGLGFLFFILSTVCSMVNEGLSNLLGWRAKTLELAVKGLLGDEVKGAAVKAGADGQDGAGAQAGGLPADLTTAVMKHWRIATLVADPSSDKTRRNRPSYLPPRAFSLAVAETLAQGAPPDATKPADPRSPWEKSDAEILADLQRTVDKLPNGKVRELLKKAAANTDQTLEGFRRNVETAFDDAMQRASGWYKRKVQVVLMVLAVLVTLAVNANTITVASRLWTDQTTRSAVSAAAVALKASPDATAKAAADVPQLKLPLGWNAGNRPGDAGAVLLSVLGWLLTIVAISLGAPFWFDLLGRIVQLRGTGGVPSASARAQTAGASPPAH